MNSVTAKLAKKPLLLFALLCFIALRSSIANAALPILADQVTDFDSLGLPSFSDIDPPGNVIDNLTYEDWRYDPLTGSTPGIISSNSPSDSDLATTGIKILTSDGSEFKATSIDYSAFVGGNASYNLALYGYKDGVQVPSYVLARSNISPPASETLSLNWDAVDEIRVVVDTDWIVFDNFASGSASLAFSVGGALSGLATGESVGILLNGHDLQVLSTDGPFSYPSQNDGAGYVITIDSQPTGQTCNVVNGSGVIAGADVSNISVNCVDNHYRVGGLVAGLVPGDALIIQNNGMDDLTITSDGVFNFATRVAYQDPYAVTVKVQPSAPSETCTVSNGSGTMGTADISNIAINCAVDQFTVGGNVSGLIPSKSVELLLNGAHRQSLGANGSFVFPALADATSYNVTIGAQPSGQTCTVSNGSGTLAGGNVSNVQVSCVANKYSVGGLLSGLASGKTVVITNNGGDDLSLTADGAFTFGTQVDSGGGYSIAVKTQPVGETCTVTNGAGTVATADINQVSITCIVDTYRVSGNLSGLAVGDSVELLLNNSLHTVMTGNGDFQFPKIADGSAYSVTIGVQPSGQTCSVSNGSGTIAGADVNDVAVDCLDNTVTGSVTGTNPSGVAASITISGCSSLISATFIPAPDSPSKPAGFDFPYGLVDFSASGCSTLANGIKVTLDFSQPIDAGAVLYKEEGAANAYFPFSAALSGSSATFLLTDNGPGDEDGAIGEIHDPAGIAVPLAGPVPPAPGSPAPVPVMPLWLLVMLGSLVSLIASMHVKLRS